jgi:phospholipase C
MTRAKKRLGWALASAAGIAGAAAATMLALSAGASPAVVAKSDDAGVPRYEHVFVIVEENKSYDEILDPARAPHIAALAREYGDAAAFYGETHPSEANYIALLGGDTFGIHDDDAFYCSAGRFSFSCLGALVPGYAGHTVRAPSLAEQLETAGFSWKGYYESLPSPGSEAVTAGDPVGAGSARNAALYAAKHSGFMNFYAVQHDPRRADHIVGFDALEADIASGSLPSFALIVPNQCDEMHGLSGIGLPPGCGAREVKALIRRGDAEVGKLVADLQSTAAWRGGGDTAIIVTFDEGEGGGREGCCAASPGGGHIPTIVITNHGPRGIVDRTPYNHYSLLRTIEDAFGISVHLGHAADVDKGVVAMTPLFAVTPAQAAK